MSLQLFAMIQDLTKRVVALETELKALKEPKANTAFGFKAGESGNPGTLRLSKDRPGA